MLVRLGGKLAVSPSRLARVTSSRKSIAKCQAWGDNIGINTQLVGAFGEKAAEAELLRRGWRTANFNTSIKNAADYDLVAMKGTRTVQLRIKACGSDWNAFQFGCRPGQALTVDDLPETDYTILVQMGNARKEDSFYVIPTRTLREQINIHRRAYLDERKRDGEPRKDLGHWTLYLRPKTSGGNHPNYGYEERWATYRDNWQSLES
jgi:hypothetical protein